MSIEAMKQALEALEGFLDITKDSQGVKGYRLDGKVAEWDEFHEVDQADDAITALRTAIEAAEKQSAERGEPVAWVCYGMSSDEKHSIDYEQAEIDAIPVGTLLYTTPPAAPVQEPVIQRVMARLADLLDEDQFNEIEGMVSSAGYNPPPAAPVQEPLTDEQIKRAKPVCADFVSFRAGVRYAEAMLREKNA